MLSKGRAKTGTVVNAAYSWGADGVKRSVKDGAGVNGFEYLGSLVYKRTGGVLSLESCGFGGGRIIKATGGYDIHYYTTDHLGSIRVITNQVGQALYRGENYLFGDRYSTVGMNSLNSRYQFNGKEKQEVGSVDLLDYGARMYDTKLARWLTQDRFAEKYYSTSQYAYCLNNPIRFIDPNGDTIRITVGGANYDYDADKRVFVNESGDAYSGDDALANSLTESLGKLMSKKAGRTLVMDVANHNEVVTIQYGEINKYNTGKKLVSWNPQLLNGETNEFGGTKRPAFIGLGHELAHAKDYINNTAMKGVWYEQGKINVPNSEKYSSHIENQIRAEHNFPLRIHYSDHPKGKLLDANLNSLHYYILGKPFQYRDYSFPPMK